MLRHFITVRCWSFTYPDFGMSLAVQNFKSTIVYGHLHTYMAECHVSGSRLFGMIGNVYLIQGNVTGTTKCCAGPPNLNQWRSYVCNMSTNTSRSVSWRADHCWRGLWCGWSHLSFDIGATPSFCIWCLACACLWPMKRWLPSPSHQFVVWTCLEGPRWR